MSKRRTMLTGVLAAAALVGAALVGGSPAQAAESTVLHTAVVIVDYTDEDANVDGETRASVADRLFGDSGSVRSFYQEASDGAVVFEPVAGQEPVLGPWDIPMAGTCDDHRGQLVEHAQKALADHGIGSEQYQRLSIIFPNERLGCDGGSAFGQQPGTVTWVPDGFLGGDASMFTHELGHNFGFNHVETVTCTAGTLDGCTTADYGDATVMGGGGYDSALSAPELMFMGWGTSGVEQVGAATGTYDLEPLHAEADVSGTRVLVIDTGVEGQQLVVAYRENGTTIDTATDEGVQLSLVTGGKLENADLVDATPEGDVKDADLPAGQRVQLPDGRTVETVSTSAGEATVRIG